MQAGQHSSLAKAVSATYNETRGIAGFYRGYTTTILREVDEDTWCDPSKSD
jgi:hypothetical protein